MLIGQRSGHLALTDRGNVSVSACEIGVENLDKSLMLLEVLSDEHLALQLHSRSG